MIGAILGGLSLILKPFLSYVGSVIITLVSVTFSFLKRTWDSFVGGITSLLGLILGSDFVEAMGGMFSILCDLNKMAKGKVMGITKNGITTVKGELNIPCDNCHKYSPKSLLKVDETGKYLCPECFENIYKDETGKKPLLYTSSQNLSYLHQKYNIDFPEIPSFKNSFSNKLTDDKKFDFYFDFYKKNIDRKYYKPVVDYSDKVDFSKYADSFLNKYRFYNPEFNNLPEPEFKICPKCGTTYSSSLIHRCSDSKIEIE